VTNPGAPPPADPNAAYALGGTTAAPRGGAAPAGTTQGPSQVVPTQLQNLPGPAGSLVSGGAQLALDPLGLGTPNVADLTPVHNAQTADYGIGGQLNTERQGLTPVTQLTPDQIAATRTQEQQNIDALTAQANGTGGPSVAQLQADRAQQANVANQMGLAAAMRGHTPGGALAQASDATANINSQAAGNAAILRAQEQLQARNALTGAITQQRSGDQASQDAADAWRKALLSGSLEASGQGTTAAVGGATAAAKNADTENKTKGGVLNAFGSLLGA
jgi:hypothetical protein